MATGSSLLNRISGCPWAIKPECLELIEQVLTSKFVKDLDMDLLKEAARPILKKIDIALTGQSLISLSEREDDTVNKSSSTNVVVKKKAVIPISGKLMNRCGWVDAVSGVTSMSSIADSIKEARDDKMINHIILRVDTPGGTVAGTPPLADLIHSVRSVKRISTFVEGEMCSAGMWIGTAADEVFASSTMDIMGSIGVVIMHVSQVGKDKSEGMKYTYLTAGKYKAMGNAHEELNSEAIAEFQRILNGTYNEFIETVAANRNISREQVEKYAEGRVYSAKELLGSGLLDGICSLDDLLND